MTLRPAWEKLVGSTQTLDYLSTLYGGAFQSEHPMQETLEDIIAEVLNDEELEVYYMRYGENMSIRNISRQHYGYLNIKGIQDLLASIETKVRDALGSYG